VFPVFRTRQANRMGLPAPQKALGQPLEPGIARSPRTSSRAGEIVGSQIPLDQAGQGGAGSSEGIRRAGGEVAACQVAGGRFWPSC